ncbi:uncharacterized protein BDZ99DRAFT_479616 [Mytilinidion resinicola]|uniref:Uncharacterized protein n=1 Tax=Mytilinidion resinicola TaxID=574789 RepID=A0A6A6YC06_9PEZI|nr:uncharacterized protein BDZ99DRAFT_479616 [Mytilinidion resinicola]KAF2806356.1 hypothetical protein BDZ99DRAFT_479616 [Mytilinidion resinicola]
MGAAMPADRKGKRCTPALAHDPVAPLQAIATSPAIDASPRHETASVSQSAYTDASTASAQHFDYAPVVLRVAVPTQAVTDASVAATMQSHHDSNSYTPQTSHAIAPSNAPAPTTNGASTAILSIPLFSAAEQSTARDAKEVPLRAFHAGKKSGEQQTPIHTNPPTIYEAPTTIFVPTKQKVDDPKRPLQPILNSAIAGAFSPHPFRHKSAQRIVDDVLSGDAEILRECKRAMEGVLRSTPHLHSNATFVLLLMFYTPGEMGREERKLGSVVENKAVARRLTASIERINMSKAKYVLNREKALVRLTATPVREFVNSLGPLPTAAVEDESEEYYSEEDEPGEDEIEENGFVEDADNDELAMMLQEQLEQSSMPWEGDDEDRLTGMPMGQLGEDSNARQLENSRNDDLENLSMQAICSTPSFPAPPDNSSMKRKRDDTEEIELGANEENSASEKAKTC